MEMSNEERLDRKKKTTLSNRKKRKRERNREKRNVNTSKTAVLNLWHIKRS